MLQLLFKESYDDLLQSVSDPTPIISSAFHSVINVSIGLIIVGMINECTPCIHYKLKFKPSEYQT